MNGQVRILRFDDTDGFRLISSSGDGFLRAYDINGNLKWETYADAWLTNISISEHYILTSSKATQSPVHLINKVTGKTIYSYPMEQIGQEIIISPDETLFWYGNATGGGTTTLKGTLFSIDGKPIFDVGNGTLSAAFTADSQYLAVMSEKCVAVYNRSGQILWTQDMLIDRASTSLNDVMWISPDASRLVVGLNTKPDSNYYGQIYFFKGGVTELAKD